MFKPTKLILQDFQSHELTEIIFDDRAILIYGTNKDDKGQESNGSGKSGIIDGFSVAVTGTAFRDVSAKELVRDKPEQMPFCKTLVDFYNEDTRENLRIIRTIHSNSKSAELSILLNGELPVGIPTATSGAFNVDVKEGNKWILAKLGLTREELLNNYIISSSSYQSFFAMGDAAKKEAINKFSKANLIDEITPELEKDLKKKEACVHALKYEITHLESKISAYNEQLRELEAIDENVLRQEEIKLLNENIAAYNETIEEQKEIIADLETQIDLTTISVNEFDIETLQQEENAARDKFKSLNEQLDNCIANVASTKSKMFVSELADVAKRRKQDEQKIKEVNAELRELDGIIIDLEKSIKGAVNCPKCKHEFSIVEEEVNIAECKNEIAEARIIRSNISEEKERYLINLSELDKEEQEYKRLIVKNSAKLDEQIKLINNHVQEASNAVKTATYRRTQKEMEANTLIKKLAKLKAEKDFAINNISFYDKKIASLEAEILTVESKTYPKQGKSIAGKIKDLQSQINSLKEELIVREEERIALAESLQYFAKFKSYLANKSIKRIAATTNKYLELMGSDLSVQIEGYKTLSNKKVSEKITTYVLRDGLMSGSYGRFSQGERIRIDLALILAQQSLINKTAQLTGGGLELLITDEIFNALDGLGVSSTLKALSKVNQPSLHITHSGANVNYEHKIEVVKENCISRI